MFQGCSSFRFGHGLKLFEPVAMLCVSQSMKSRSLQVKLSGRNSHQQTDTRSNVIEALNEALVAASPEQILKKRLKMKDHTLNVDSVNLDLKAYQRIIVIGGGKAVASMASGLEELLGKQITAGVVNIPNYLKPKPKTKRIELHAATHPIPSELGMNGVERMLSIVGRPKKTDFIICLISGGGSALMPMPLEGLKLSDDRKVTDLLLRSGAAIGEINTVRKHLSAIKGGRLAEKLFPARVLSLIISDVVGDSLESIASGPTVPDTTTYADAKEIMLRFGIWKKIPDRVRNLVEECLKDKSLETPKPNSKFFDSVSNVLIGTNEHSCLAAQRSLERAGYKASVLSTHVQGEAKEIGRFYSGLLRDMKSSHAIICGGETTVTITTGGGHGGRNQELVLSSAIGISGLNGAVIASMGTDGVDGPTNAAGAIADSTTIERARKAGLDPTAILQKHNSYDFFKRLGDLIMTGPTGTNVNDISILATNSARKLKD